MVDALVKYKGLGGNDPDVNLGIWTFVELPRVGENLMLYGALDGLSDEGYTGWVVEHVYHVPVRNGVEFPQICLLVDHGPNRDVRNVPPAPHHGNGMMPGCPKCKSPNIKVTSDHSTFCLNCQHSWW